MKNIIYLFLALVFILLGFKSDDKADFSKEEMELINHEIEKRLAEFTAKKKKECKEKLLEMVDNKVDSILMYDDLNLLLGADTSAVKAKPSKPLRPEVLKPNDDTPLEPLIKNEDDILNEIKETEIKEGKPSLIDKKEKQGTPEQEETIPFPNKKKNPFKRNGKKMD